MESETYIKLADNRTSYFDIDETLISYCGDTFYNPEDILLLKNNKVCVNVTPMRKHIDLMVELKALGFNIIVWSKSGSDHCERVIKLLQIEHLVDMILPKPELYVDDMPFEQQYVKRVFLY